MPNLWRAYFLIIIVRNLAPEKPTRSIMQARLARIAATSPLRACRAVPFTLAEMAVLNQLRRAAMAGRVAARTDLFAACASLKTRVCTQPMGCMDTFVRCLPEAMGRPVIWFAPGAHEVSRDEAWAMRCLDRITAGDDASLTFLLATRIRNVDRCNIGYLLGRIAAYLTRD